MNMMLFYSSTVWEDIETCGKKLKAALIFDSNTLFAINNQEFI